MRFRRKPTQRLEISAQHRHVNFTGLPGRSLPVIPQAGGCVPGLSPVNFIRRLTTKFSVEWQNFNSGLSELGAYQRKFAQNGKILVPV